MPAPKKPDDRQFKVGDKIRVNLHHGKIEDAVVRAVIEHTDGLKLQVDFGHEQTALIEEWQVVEWDLSRRVCPIPACSSWKAEIVHNAPLWLS